MSARSTRRFGVAVAVAVLATACATSGGSSTGSKGYVAGDGSVLIIPAADRPAVPDLHGPGVGGGKVSVRSDLGKVVVINVWASWCGPCRAEAKDLVAAAHQLDGAAFVGIDTRDDESAAAAFVREQRVPYPSLLDQDGSEMLKFYGTVNPKALPTTMVVDKHGKVAAVIGGSTTTITLVDLVHQIGGGR